MNTKPLSKTNPFIRNPKQRADMVRDHVITSSAIEGVNVRYSEKKGSFVIKKNGGATSHKA